MTLVETENCHDATLDQQEIKAPVIGSTHFKVTYFDAIGEILPENHMLAQLVQSAKLRGNKLSICVCPDQEFIIDKMKKVGWVAIQLLNATGEKTMSLLRARVKKISIVSFDLDNVFAKFDLASTPVIIFALELDWTTA